jgi:outer membrane protein assembly factor BamB
MRLGRRALLAASGCLVTGLAGCLDGTTDASESGCLTPVNLPTMTGPDTWPQFAATATNANFVPGSGVPAAPSTVGWRSPGSEALLPPVIAEDLYVADSGTGSVSAVAADDTVRWRYDEFDRTRWPVAVSDGTIVALTENADGNVLLQGIDAEEGTVRWDIDTTASFRGGLLPIAPTVRDGTVYVCTNTGVRAVRTDDGTAEWHTELGANVVEGSDGSSWRTLWATPAVTENHVYTFDRNDTSGDTRTIHALDHGGNIAWEREISVPDDWRIPGHVVAGGQRLFVVAHREDFRPMGQNETDADGESPKSRLFALDADTGDTAWRTDIEGTATTPPALAGGILFVTSRRDDGSGRLLAYDVESQCVRWEYESDRGVVGSPAVTPEALCISEGNRLTALDVRNGEPRWHLGFESNVSAPAVADGSLYTVDRVYTDQPMRVVRVD